ncbi:hypothetical protein FQZ97_665560 [compost metagenome]
MPEFAGQARLQFGDGGGVQLFRTEPQGFAQLQMGPLVDHASRRVEDFDDRAITQQRLVRARIQQRRVILIDILGQRGHGLGDLDDLRMPGIGHEAQEPRQDARQCTGAQRQRALLVQQPGGNLLQDAGLGQRDDLAHRHLATTPLGGAVARRGGVHQGDLVAFALQVQRTADSDDATTDDNRRLHGLALLRLHTPPFLPTKSPREKPSQ